VHPPRCDRWRPPSAASTRRAHLRAGPLRGIAAIDASSHPRRSARRGSGVRTVFAVGVSPRALLIGLSKRSRSSIPLLAFDRVQRTFTDA
jgi:hypothetical protein